MGLWGPELYADDLALDIRREYNVLLSVGKETSEIEKMLMRYYSDIFDCNDPDEDVFWFVLAICEWKKGRLTPYVKNKALLALDSGRDLERWNTPNNQKNYRRRKEVLEKLRNTLESVMPEAKKIKKPSVRHCPWKAGSLLAYKISSSKLLIENNHPCLNKYVLLRIVKIKKHPVTRRFETEYYDESMIVGLYDWIGNEIPDPEITSNLNYTYIAIESILPKPEIPFDFTPLNGLPEAERNNIIDALTNAIKPRKMVCYDLDWHPLNKKVITYLGRDEQFEQAVPAFFESSVYNCPMGGYYAFDVNLAKRYEENL